MDTQSRKGFEFGKMKVQPSIPDHQINETIKNNPIYSEVMKHYKQQIAYGLHKYPEPLNMDTWNLVETLEHEISELVDQLNYKVMLKLKLIKLEEEKQNGTF